MVYFSYVTCGFGRFYIFLDSSLDGSSWEKTERNLLVCEFSEYYARIVSKSYEKKLVFICIPFLKWSVMYFSISNVLWRKSWKLLVCRFSTYCTRKVIFVQKSYDFQCITSFHLHTLVSNLYHLCILGFQCFVEKKLKAISL